MSGYPMLNPNNLTFNPAQQNERMRRPRRFSLASAKKRALGVRIPQFFSCICTRAAHVRTMYF